ncbi:hypothetical protein WG66_010579 [Moniliophthora roreri]|nr:hypothetical protein WG66_010579 [Moniliophthora roreri]
MCKSPITLRRWISTSSASPAVPGSPTATGKAGISVVSCPKRDGEEHREALNILIKCCWVNAKDN